MTGNSVAVKYTGKVYSDKTDLKNELAKQVVYNQQPNKKFMSIFRLKLGIYTMSVLKNENRLVRKQELEAKINTGNYTKKDSTELSKLMKKKKFENFLNETSGGEPPVLFDSTTMATSIKRMRNYLFYHGYFYSDVSATYKTKKKKTNVTYHVSTGPQFTYREVNLIVEDSSLYSIVTKGPKNMLLKKGDPFDIDVVKKERQRLADLVQNEGYFTFSPDFIYLNIDSTVGNQQIDVNLIVKNEEDALLHKKYSYVEINYEILNFDNKKQNLLLKREDFIYDTICDVNYRVLKTSVLPRALTKSTYIKPGDYYNKDQLQKTRNALNGLGVFRFVNIEHVPISLSPDESGLYTSIKCAPSKRHAFSTDVELNTNAQSTLGFNVVGAYRNNNLFRTAAKFQFNISTGLDFQLLKEKRFENSAINAININLEAKINLARLFPTFKKNKCITYQKYKPRTFVSVNYNFQKRINLYNLQTIGVSYGYEWYNDKFRHIFTPLSFTYVLPSNLSDSFNTILQQSPRFRQSFSNQFIMGQEYTFSYTNQNLNVGKYKNFFYFRGNVFLSGNLLYAFTSIKQKGNELPYKLGGINFSQFARFEVEPRYFFNFRRGQAFSLRMFAGIGIPYGNSTYRDTAVMPYFKQFFVGGPNSLRGWGFRRLGPGGFDTYSENRNNLDQTADMKFEFNAEYRFNIYKTFKGALFTDIGNIWLIKEDPSRKLGHFDARRFMKELAWDVGFGLRMDLNFFVVRFDVGIALYDPAFEEGNRWTFNKINNDAELIYKQPRGKELGWYKFQFRDFVGLNFAIGYPF
ncbi:MAG TPA: BamA/TamA family outer membrane protein [Chitinophagales bacterium]|nr:BamA/TamA family outer membrane protein [Chitinophagales bacterium]